MFTFRSFGHRSESTISNGIEIIGAVETRDCCIWLYHSNKKQFDILLTNPPIILLITAFSFSSVRVSFIILTHASSISV